MQEKFEDSKGVVRTLNYRTDNTATKRKEKGEKGQAIIYKIQHRLLNIEHNEIHYYPGVNSCGPEGYGGMFYLYLLNQPLVNK